MITQIAPCPLCQTPAARATLPHGDGYLYFCPDCGGRFELGLVAQVRADRREMHPDIVTSVRRLIADGKRPRVEFNVAAANNPFSVSPLPSSEDSTAGCP